MVLFPKLLIKYHDKLWFGIIVTIKINIRLLFTGIFFEI